LSLDVQVDPGLREVDTGNWTGLTREEIRARFPDQQHHDGESHDDLVQRVTAALDRICETHPRERVLVVTHGGALRWTLHGAGGAFLERIEHCGVYRMAFRDGALKPSTSA
jgi:broad specificity phosphatase PhoE